MTKAVLGVVLFILLLVPVHATSCDIFTEYGWQPDHDCDNTFDRADNCPAVANPLQEDADRDDIGDACDLFIEEIRTAPDTHLRQGEFVHITAKLVNNKQDARRDIDVTIENAALELHHTHRVPFVPAGEAATADFWLRVPKCAQAGTHMLTITTSDSGVREYPLVVDTHSVCGTEDGPLDTSLITLFDKVDIDRGESALVPVRIVNLGPTDARYHVSIANLENWGTWRVDPAQSMELIPDHEGTLYVLLQTSAETPAGTKRVEVTVASGNQQTTVPLDVYVRSTTSIATPLWKVAKLLMVIFLMLFIGIVGIILVGYFDRKMHERKSRKVNV